MDTATITRPGPAQPSTAQPVRPPRSRRRTRVRARPLDLHRPALALLLIVTFLLRLWGIKQGLPYSYNVDEATHFVPRAVGFFGHDLNPHYFLNPPAYSYLLHIVFELWFGSADAVRRAYATNPTELFVVARVVAAVLGTIAVWLTYLAGSRFFNRNIGLLAAAMFGLAFLPIFYSHLALNDVPTLAPVGLSLYGTSGVMRRGRLRDYAIAGLGVGLAAATKYTGGITLLCLGAAFVSDSMGGAFWVASRRFAVALLLALIAFVVANPYSLLDPSSFLNGVGEQASLAAGQDPVKLGTRPGGGTGYYMWTFTWGLGWGPTLAAIGGSVLLLVRRRLAMAMVLVPAPIVFVIFMGHQQRYFGRWLMPVFPIVAILGAYGAVELVRWLIRARRIPAPLAAGIVSVVVLAQGLIAAVHDDAVLSRPDTRSLARAWMVRNVPPGSKVVIEPVVADNWGSDIGTSLPWTPTGERWYRFPTWMTQLDAQGNPLPFAARRYVVVDQYERYLQPALLNEYADEGFCWIVTGSSQAGRAFAQPQLAPSAIAYYGDLASRAELLYHVSPFSTGAHPVPFNFDWASDYYPRQYRRPGPELSVYRLSGGKCG
jgi:4-amino-4-deoxy-L-arabinose transferase-like glycosyltransferase